MDSYTERIGLTWLLQSTSSWPLFFYLHSFLCPLISWENLICTNNAGLFLSNCTVSKFLLSEQLFFSSQSGDTHLLVFIVFLLLSWWTINCRDECYFNKIISSAHWCLQLRWAPAMCCASNRTELNELIFALVSKNWMLLGMTGFGPSNSSVRRKKKNKKSLRYPKTALGCSGRGAGEQIPRNTSLSHVGFTWPRERNFSFF